MALIFRAGSLLCALPLDAVIETMRPLPTRPLAGTPPFVRGISLLRGVPAPVLDVARLLAGEEATVDRYITVRTEHGPVAFAAGTVLGIRGTPRGGPAVYPGVSSRLVAGVGTLDDQPLLLLQSMRVLPEDVWLAAAEAVLS
jgi:purine-binding chemotaxis protein CheW